MKHLLSIVWRPFQSALPPNESNNSPTLPPVTEPEHHFVKALQTLAYPDGKPNKHVLPIGTVPVALAGYLTTVDGVSQSNLESTLAAIGAADAHAHEFMNRSKMEAISELQSNLGIPFPSLSTGSYPQLDKCDHCDKAVPTRWFIGPLTNLPTGL